MAKPRRVYSPEQVAFLEEHVKGRSVEELRGFFNAHFGVSYSYESVRAALKNRSLSSGYDTRFKKGIASYHPPKGIRQSPATEFKPGNIPVNHRPIGSERVTVDGYIEVKIEEPHKWRMKHVVVWEAARGPVPKGNVVLFADGNRLNPSLENLLLVTRSQLAVLNKHRLLHKDQSLNDTALLTADLILRIGAVKRKQKNKGRGNP